MEETVEQRRNRAKILDVMAMKAKTAVMRRHYLVRRDAILCNAKPIPATADGKEPTILAQRIAELLNQNGPMRSVAIMKATGATRDTVHRCLRRFFQKAGDCLWTFKS